MPYLMTLRIAIKLAQAYLYVLVKFILILELFYDLEYIE